MKFTSSGEGELNRDQLILKLEDCTEIRYERDLHQIVEGWRRFANIEWLSATCREDVNLVRRHGVKALSNLLPVAQRDTNQSAVIVRFLLNLYNGPRFPMDMTRLRGLDHELFMDCITVLMMDSTQGAEIHNYVENGQEFWEQMAEDWGQSPSRRNNCD